MKSPRCQVGREFHLTLVFSRPRSRSAIRTSCAALPSRLFRPGRFRWWCFRWVFRFCPQSGEAFCFWPSGSFPFFFCGLMARFLRGSGSGRFFVSGFRGGVAVSVLVFGGVWFRFWLCCSLASLHLLLRRKTALPGIRPQRRLPPFLPPMGLSGVTRLLLGVVPWTGRSVAVGGASAFVTPPTNSRRHTFMMTIVLPGHRWPPLQGTQAVSPAPGSFGGFLFLFATQPMM